MIELEKLFIRDESFIVEARRKIQALAQDLKFDSLRTARLAICASEISRYIYHYQEPVLIMGLERKNTDTCLKLVFKCKKEKSGKGSLGLKVEKFFDGFKVYYTAEGFEVLEGYKHIEDPAFEFNQEFIHAEKEKLLRLSKSEELIALIDQVKAEKVRVEELKRLDQLKADFISTVSHELRTPLSITKLGISLVLNRTTGEINEKQKEVLSDAKSNIDRLARIIDDLLDISKIEAGKVELKKELVNISGLIRQVASSFDLNIKEKSLGLKIHIPEKQIDAYVDPDKITQVFTNLIGNALKFTDRGYIEVSLQEKEKEIACIVADTGVGIGEEELPKLFRKFEQFGRLPGPGERGTGLGLSITKGIIELHGGKIWAESKVGQGTIFSFILPKYTTEEIIKEYVNNGMREAMGKKTCMTLMISITEFNKLKQEVSDEQMGVILKGMERIIKDSLRREGDVVLKDSGEMVVILAGCEKEATLRVKNRLKEALDNYFANMKLSQEIKLKYGSELYPDEAKKDEELIKKAKEA